MLRMIAAATIVVIAVALVLVALAWWGQERILFQPPPGVRAPLDGERLEFRGEDGTPLFALVVRDSAAPRPGDPLRTSGPPPLVIHFHGNAEVAAWAVPWATELARRTGATVLLAEYRGYAGIPGAPTYASSAGDARALWRTAVARFDAEPAATVIHGFSLGSAVAAELAEHVRPRALVLEAPFTSASAMAARMGPLLRGPLWRLIARVHFDTRSIVARLDVPVHVAHGASDRIIPAAMGEAVHRAAKRPGTLLLVPGAGHNDLRGGREYWGWLVGAIGRRGEETGG